jgi:hypothetical protein
MPCWNFALRHKLAGTRAIKSAFNNFPPKFIPRSNRGLASEDMLNIFIQSFAPIATIVNAIVVHTASSKVPKKSISMFEYCHLGLITSTSFLF